MGLAQVTVYDGPKGDKVNTGIGGWGFILILATATHPPAAVIFATYNPGEIAVVPFTDV